MALLAAALTLVRPPTASARDDRGPGPLPWRIGYQVGFCADAAAFPDTAGSTVEVYIRIRPSLISDLSHVSSPPPEVRLRATLEPMFGKGRSTSREQKILVNPADTVDALGEVVVLTFPAKPGRHKLEVFLETPRQALARRGVRKPERERVQGEIEVPGAQAGREISDVEFVWGEARQSGSGVFGRSGRALVPNPERLYGLYANDLRAFFQARGEPGRPWLWVARALDSAGQVVGETSGRGDADASLSAEIALDVSSFPAGGYDLEVKAWQEGDPGALLRRSRFGVAWQEETWKQDPQAAQDDVHFLLSADEEESFARQSPGEQERILGEYWKRRDPTPDTGENEARTRYYRRVKFANLTYGRYGLGRGMFSDMGRAYIRYGEPSEVVRQVIPSLDDNLAQIIYDLAKSESRSLGSVSSREIGSDMRPFEMWIYDGPIPLPIDADPDHPSSHISGTRLVFLFVDEHWTGDYRLLYSSE